MTSTTTETYNTVILTTQTATKAPNTIEVFMTINLSTMKTMQSVKHATGGMWMTMIANEALTATTTKAALTTGRHRRHRRRSKFRGGRTSGKDWNKSGKPPVTETSG